jgi:glycosyltransferase involved in cell wall biosynthesis
MPLENLAARITRDNHAGLTVAPGDMEGFLAAASQLYHSPDLRAGMARSARAYAEETFPIEKTASVFDEILAK